jgi:anti-sigma factor (TIGR02949 family)
MSHDHAARHGADHVPLDCDAALEKLFDFLDGEVDDTLEARLKAHVSGCKHCFETADFERRFLDVVRRARNEERCPKAVRDRVLHALRTEGIEA